MTTYISICDNEFWNFLKKITVDASIRKQEFLTTDLNEIQKEQGFAAYLEKLCLFYRDLALFPDKEVINHFTKSGLKKKSLKWFIPMKKILSEIEKIIKSGKVDIAGIHLMCFLKCHLDIKIVHQLIIDFNLKNTYGKNMVHSLIDNAFRRRVYGKGKPKTYKDLHDFELHKKLESFEKMLPDRKRIKEELLELSLGGTKDLFLSRIFQCFVADGLKESQLSNLLYDFFKLIMKDDLRMYSLDEFLLNGGKSYRSYRIYRAKRMKDLFIKSERKTNETGNKTIQFFD